MVDCLYSTGVNEQRRHQATPDAGPGYLRIGELARRTGVSPELLRAWEQRYGLLQPTRTPGGFRLYSATDEARVQHMQGLVSGGLAAAQAARLVLSDDGSAPPPMASPSATTLEEAAGDLTASLDRLDEQAANTALDRLFSTYTVETVLRDVVLPYLHRLGERWEAGEVSVAREHSPPTCSEAASWGSPRAGARAEARAPCSPVSRANTTSSAC
jgi:DNA-binding transcriptional MerR regulator